MKVVELVAAVKARTPVAKKLADAQVQAIVASTLKELTALIESATEAEAAKLVRFGNFKVKMVPNKANPSEPVRRIIFIPSKIKLGEKPAPKAKGKG